MNQPQSVTHGLILKLFKVSCFSLVAVSAVIVPTLLCAQQAESGPSETPVAGAPLLPDVLTDGVGIVVGSESAVQFKGLLIPELFSHVKAGTVQMNAVGRLGYEPTAVLRRSAARSPSQHKLFGTRGEGRDDPSKLDAATIVQGVNSFVWQRALLEMRLRVKVLRQRTAVRQFDLRQRRVYPRLLLEQERSTQLFRELISVESPAVLSSMRWLTYRFTGADEDLFWMYSPAISKARQLTGSNRADSVLRMGFGWDDLFGWSGKAELVDARLDRTVEALTPFSAWQIQRAVARDPCLEISGGNLDSTAGTYQPRWNFESNRAPRAAPWLRADAVYVPRTLWRLEFDSRDPYAQHGRQIVYVDAGTFAPVYRFVYDRAGRPWKAILSGYGVAEAGEDVALYPGFTVVNDFLLNEAYLIDLRSALFCSAFPPGRSLADFEPKRLGEADFTLLPEGNAAAAATPVASVAPASPEEASEIATVEDTVVAEAPPVATANPAGQQEPSSAEVEVYD